METLLHLRGLYPKEHFKAIRFRIQFPTRLTGHLIYLREDYEGYNLIHGDEIDTAILYGIKSFTDKAEIQYHTTLFTKEELEHALHLTKGGAEKNCIINFMPLADIETYNELSRRGQLKLVPKNVRMTFWSNDQELIDNSVRSEFLVKIQYDKMNLVDTLKYV